MQETQSAASDVIFESMSLFAEDAPLLKGVALSTLLPLRLSKYHHEELAPQSEQPSPQLFNMPKVFRSKLIAYSRSYYNEINEQNRLADMLRYNFSNGEQISAKDILRHPFYKIVPKELLPQIPKQNSVFSRWPLTQQKEHLFLSQNLKELEDIIQALLDVVATQVRQGKVVLYLQSKDEPEKALPLKSIEFDVGVELDWRVEFVEKEELETEFKLISSARGSIYFFDSFALDTDRGVVLVHPWLVEMRELKKVMPELVFDGMPTVHTEGEVNAKAVLKHLRTRSIPVKITGDSVAVAKEQGYIDVFLNELGYFYIQNGARILGQKDLARRGFTPKTLVYMQTLSEGLPFLLNVDAKDLASRTHRKRDWDMKLLKHLGILQYVMLETLSWHFDGCLTDGRVVERKEIFPFLHEKIQTILVQTSGGIFEKETALAGLCSQSVLNYFDDFVSKVLQSMTLGESFYSESGEVLLDGVVEREFQLLYEMLKSLALSTRGEAFRKTKTPLLDKIYVEGGADDPYLAKGLFYFPGAKDQIHASLESLQLLVPKGFRLFYRGQALQELSDDDFQVDFNLQSDNTRGDFNWFELNPKFFLQGHEIDPKEMGKFGSSGVIEYGGKLYLVPRKQMPSLRRLENFWQKLQKGKKDSGQKTGNERVYHLQRHQILELLALRTSGYAIRGDEEWKKICDFYDGLGTSTRELVLPDTINAELKPYQRVGVQWLQDLYQLKLGALLADDMGLGKTLQTLCFLEDLRVKGELGQVLIVVPSSLIFNWQSEIEKFTAQLPLHIFSSKDRESIFKKLEAKEQMIVITTYGLLMEHESYLNQYHWKVLIFDEAQNLKNISTKRTSSARSLNAQFKICLTGTPMENHYGEFYSLVDLLVPGSLGKIEDFRRQYVNTDIVSKEEIADLKLKIKPLLLRRTKKEILDQLPEKQETKVSIAFEEKQMQIYRDIALSYNQKVQESLLTQGEASVQLQMLTAILRLRQACSDPAALPNVKYDRVPPKLEALMDSLGEIVESGESALVFTQFLQTLEHTAKLLRAQNIPVFVLHGGVPTKQRQKTLEDFNKVQGGAVLVMTLKTGGVGLNLTKASYVFHLEPWWNPSVENQATDRAHRLGQSKAVQVFKYIMHESLEEKIELLKGRKDQKFQSLFAASESATEIGAGSGALTKEDFDLLIGAK